MKGRSERSNERLRNDAAKADDRTVTEQRKAVKESVAGGDRTVTEQRKAVKESVAGGDRTVTGQRKAVKESVAGGEKSAAGRTISSIVAFMKLSLAGKASYLSVWVVPLSASQCLSLSASQCLSVPV